MRTKEPGTAVQALSSIWHGERRKGRFWEHLSLRKRLMLLAVATILPFTLFSVLAFAAMFHQQTVKIEQTTLGMSRALADSISARMQQTIAALEAFSLAQSLDVVEGANLNAAYAAARLLRSSHPEWQGIVLAKPDGSVIFGSESPPGTGLSQVVEGTSFADVARTQAAVVGAMVTGPRGNIGFPVRVPVMRGGELKYVLTAVVNPDSILQVVLRQQVPGDWVVSVYDSATKRVARTREHRRFFGTAPSPMVQKILAGLGTGKEAFATTYTMEGEEAYTAVSRIEGTNWTLALGASKQVAEGALWRSASLYIAGLLITLAVGGIAFLQVGRSIIHRATALAECAEALGRGESLPAPTKGLQEFDAVSLALWEAGKRFTQHEGEREALLRSETEARAAAERVQGRLQQLLAASLSLSHALDEASTLDAIASAVVPNMADILRIDLLRPDGTLERKLTSHRNPEREAAIDRVVRSGSITPTTPGSLAWVVASGQESVYHFDDAGTSGIEDPTFRTFVRVTGMRAVCAVPLIARGRMIGAMAAIQSSSDRRFGEDEVTMLRELGKRAALALDNSRLYTECTSALDRATAAGKSKDE